MVKLCKNFMGGFSMIRNKIFALFLAFSTISCLLMASNNASAARLYTAKKEMVIGETKYINLWSYYGKKKPAWSTRGGKFRITSKSKRGCKIKAINIGTGTLNCKIGKKTYKMKIKVKEKNKATFDNYQAIEDGMYINEVEEQIGEYTEIYSSRNHTQEEYNDYLRYNKEDGGGWEDSLWLEETVYKWYNSDTGHTILVTFHDGVVFKKQYF